MSLVQISEHMLPSIETELRKLVAKLDEPRTQLLHSMLTYHFGWNVAKTKRGSQGKRIRPLLVLLTCASCNSDWTSILPAAAAVELVHNFSLVHDDIQDNSPKRHGRETVWVKWGVPQGINAGDALFALSNQAIMDLDFPCDIVLKSAKILHDTCLNLTRGQFLDMSYENQSHLTTEDYWPMIKCKTAALLAACCELGSLLGGVTAASQEAFKTFGHYLGLAFQVHDDFLGIWGDSQLTGKSNESDLITRKKSLPVLFGLEKNGSFANRWINDIIKPEDVQGLADQLASEGALLYTQESADRLTDLALSSLRSAEPKGEFGEALFEMANNLLSRPA